MRNRIDAALESDGLDALEDVLRDASTAQLRHAARRLTHSASGDDLWERVEELATSSNSSVRHLACEAGPALASFRIEVGMDVLQSLAQDPEWTVREAAHAACGDVLRSQFSDALDIFRT